MSRLRSVTVPFVQGQDDRVDPKLLPDGTFSRVRNGRLRQAGELSLRRGWRPVAMAGASDEGASIGDIGDAQDLYSTGDSLVALARRNDALLLATKTDGSVTRPWTIRAASPVPPATHVRATGNVADVDGNVLRASAAVTSDGVWGAVLVQSSTQTVFRVFRLETDETLFYNEISPGADVRKVVSMGSTFGIVRNTGTALTLTSYDPANPQSSLVLVGTLETVTASHFDVAVAHETTPAALHVVTTEAAAVVYRQYTFAGAQTGSDKTVVASGARSAYLATDDVTAHCVYQASATGELSLLSFAATGAFTTSAGPTALDAGVDIENDVYAVGYNGKVWVAAQLDTGGDSRVYHVNATTHAIVTNTTHASTLLSGGWVAVGDVAGFGAVRGSQNESTGQDQVFLDNACPWFSAGFRLGVQPPSGATPYAPGVSPSGDVVCFFGRTSETTVVVPLAVFPTVVRSRQVTARAFRVLDGGRRQGAVFGGVLYLSGGALVQYDGGVLTDNGIHRPVIDTVAESNSTGTIANGDYNYRAVVVWTDAGGRIHRSVVSDEFSFTTTGANDTVAVTVHLPKTLRRTSDSLFDPVIELYRTEAGPGELFYLVASVTADSDDATDVIDTLPDASIIDNKRLYTEGEFGTISGALDVTPPDPSSFVAALRDRVVLGGGGAAYQFSQTVLPEEPVCFTQPGVSGPVALAYQDSVEGRLTGVATLDDTVVLGTASALFVSGGEGPNLAGVGEFASPARLPGDVGIYDARSLVEDAAGLWFLGDADKLYLLPRGQGTPSFAGEPVQDRLTDDVVGAGRDVQDDVTAWAVADGTLVLRHGVGGQWLTDDLPFDPVALVSHRGRLYAVDDAGDVWEQAEAGTYGDAASGATAVALVVETGDVAAFGSVGGWGRLAGVEILGEFQTAAELLCEISYDSGKTYSSLGTHAVSGGGLAAGDAFTRQWYPANQRGGKFRLRFTMTPTSTTTEGCRLAGFVLYYTQRNGPSRLDSAKRR